MEIEKEKGRFVKSYDLCHHNDQNILDVA